jgi:hypothetical protein
MVMCSGAEVKQLCAESVVSTASIGDSLRPRRRAQHKHIKIQSNTHKAKSMLIMQVRNR